MGSFTEWKKEITQKESERIGDVYAECVKRGCDIGRLRALATRTFLYPVKQAKQFVESRPDSSNKFIKQYKIFLSVLIEKRPDSELVGEWREALKVLDDGS